MLGPVKGFRPCRLGSMGELTEVASAKRAVRGVWMDSLEAPELRRGRTSISWTRTCAPLFFSSAAADAELLGLGSDMVAVLGVAGSKTNSAG